MNLAGKKALICGVANERSIAWAIAKDLFQQNVKLAFSYGSPTLERRVRPLAESVQADLIELCDVSQDLSIEHLFEKIQNTWGEFDILVHSIAFANKQELEQPFFLTSRAGFQLALDVSVYSLIALSQKAVPLMPRGGTILTLTYYGAHKVIPNYNVMGVAKAALESCVRYLAYDLGAKKIRVHAISAGPIKTLAAAGIKNFRTLLDDNIHKNPLKENVCAEDVAYFSRFLCSDEAAHMTGGTHYIDSGANIMGV